MKISIYGKEISVPEEIDKMYHENYNFKSDFDDMIKSIISASKSHGNRFGMLFDNSPENIMDVN